MIIYGINPVLEAIKAGRVREIRVAERADDRLQRLLDEAARAGVRVRRVTRDVLDAESQRGAHQGVVADVERRAEVTLDDLASGADGPPLIVVLDEVEDPQNVGAILRTVDAAGATGVVRQTRRAAPLDGAAAKASAGAVHHVRDRRRREHRPVARGAEEGRASGPWDSTPTPKCPTMNGISPFQRRSVVGAEGHGLRRLVRERCDQVVSIPMRGHVGSLNVSAAAAIVLFEAVRQRRSRSRGRPTVPDGNRR